MNRVFRVVKIRDEAKHRAPDRLFEANHSIHRDCSQWRTISRVPCWGKMDAEKVSLTSMPRPSPQLAVIFVGNRVEKVVVLVGIPEWPIK